jgi:spore coat protein U-like protein
MMNKTTRRLMVVTTAVFGALVISQGTAAAQANDTLPVQATVVANCNINAPNTLQFGNYDPAVVNATADLDAATTIEVRCTKNSAGVWIGLDLGANPSGATRRMTDGTEFLTYEIYQDAPGGTVWGNALATGVTYSPTTSSWVNLDVFGRVPQAQDVGVGTYNDSVLATINF